MRISHRKNWQLMLLMAASMAGSLAFQTGLLAQGPGGRGGGPPQPAKAAAPIDLTGYWVSVVTEDWRYRMVTPAPGDYQGVPLNAEALKIADAWDPAKDEAAGDQCKSYGPPGLIRIPGLLHLTWVDDNTLQMEADAGKQTRTFHFGNWKAPGGPATLQGDTTAAWDMQREGGKVVTGSMRATTTNLKGGYLRKNGVPYSENSTVNEFFDLVKERNGTQLLVVTTVVNDPKYLRQPFVISTHFKKQADNAGWHPSECSAKW